MCVIASCVAALSSFFCFHSYNYFLRSAQVRITCYYSGTHTQISVLLRVGTYYNFKKFPRCCAIEEEGYVQRSGPDAIFTNRSGPVSAQFSFSLFNLLVRNTYVHCTLATIARRIKVLDSNPEICAFGLSFFCLVLDLFFFVARSNFGNFL